MGRRSSRGRRSQRSNRAVSRRRIAVPFASSPVVTMGISWFCVSYASLMSCPAGAGPTYLYIMITSLPERLACSVGSLWTRSECSPGVQPNSNPTRITATFSALPGRSSLPLRPSTCVPLHGRLWLTTSRSRQDSRWAVTAHRLSGTRPERLRLVASPQSGSARRWIDTGVVTVRRLLEQHVV